MKTAIAAAAALCLGSVPTMATTYHIMDHAGSLFLHGTIETDGRVGALYSGDIVDWKLMIGQPNSKNVIILTPSTSTLAIDGSDLVANPKTLSFDFADTTSEGAFSIQGSISTNEGGFVYVSVGYNLLNGSGEPAIAYLQLQDYYANPITQFSYPTSNEVIGK